MFFLLFHHFGLWNVQLIGGHRTSNSCFEANLNGGMILFHFEMFRPFFSNFVIILN